VRRLQWYPCFQRSQSLLTSAPTAAGLGERAAGPSPRLRPAEPRPGRKDTKAFTLLELLVVIAIIALLAALLLPALTRGREKAKVVRVHLELHGIGLALEMYSSDNAGRVPPVRVNCNSDLANHWCQLPIELARDGYLPRSEAAGREANLIDLFDPGHTYKYAAPGLLLLNGAPAGNYALWIPTNAPDMAGGGKYFSDPKSAPVRWAVWSLGPRPNSRKTQDTCAPLGSGSWYRGGGDGGVLVRFAVRDGTQYKSP
jgi:prepilin-type N-terminal cleavage/methylation domain-containing protein